MNDLIPLLVIGAGLYYFWPQIQGLLNQTTVAPITTTPAQIAPATQTQTVSPGVASQVISSSVTPIAIQSPVIVGTATPSGVPMVNPAAAPVIGPLPSLPLVSGRGSSLAL